MQIEILSISLIDDNNFFKLTSGKKLKKTSRSNNIYCGTRIHFANYVIFLKDTFTEEDRD